MTQPLLYRKSWRIETALTFEEGGALVVQAGNHEPPLTLTHLLQFLRHHKDMCKKGNNTNDMDIKGSKQQKESDVRI